MLERRRLAYRRFLSNCFCINPKSRGGMRADAGSTYRARRHISFSTLSLHRRHSCISTNIVHARVSSHAADWNTLIIFFPTVLTNSQYFYLVGYVWKVIYGWNSSGIRRMKSRYDDASPTNTIGSIFICRECHPEGYFTSITDSLLACRLLRVNILMCNTPINIKLSMFWYEQVFNQPISINKWECVENSAFS